MATLEGFRSALGARRPRSPARATRGLATRASLAAAGSLLAVFSGRALAGPNDLKLINLCRPVPGQECPWVQRDASGRVTGVSIDADGRSDYRSLMSELGVVMSPKIPMPADTLGFAGILVSGELGFTQISHNESFWDGVEAVNPLNRTTSRPDAMLTTVGVFLRKGLWFPVPALEAGGGVVNLIGSQMLSWQTYAKFAIHEGYHDLPFPSLAVRAALAYLTGTDQVNLQTTSFDAVLSKAFGVLKTLRVEPFGGLSLLIIKASGKTIDFTPSCDASQAALASAGQTVGDCKPTQIGSTDDLLANATFPGQEAIRRYRFFGGAKLKFGLLAIIGEYEFYPGGTSRDQSSSVDHSAGQSAFSLSTGLDF